MRILPFLACAALALTGCRSMMDHVVEAAQTNPPPPPQPVAAAAAMSGPNGAGGQIQFKPGDLCVEVTGNLIGLPANSDVVLSIRNNLGSTREETGKLMLIPDSNFTGIIGTVHADAFGRASLDRKCTKIIFDSETMIGRCLCILSDDGAVVATGVIGISKER